MTSGALPFRKAMAVLIAVLLFGAVVRLALVSLPSDCPVSFWGGDETMLCHDLHSGPQLDTPVRLIP